MDRWPGAYPASEPPTPAPETPQQQQQPRYPTQQQPQRQPQSPTEHATQPQFQPPALHPLGGETKLKDASVPSYTDSGSGLTDDAECYPPPQAQRNHTVQEALSGGTYSRGDEARSFLLQPKEGGMDTAQQGQSGQAGWPLPGVQEQRHDVEHQPRKIQKHEQQNTQREAWEVVEQQPHQLRHESREVSRQPRTDGQQSSETDQHSSRGSHSATASHEPSVSPYWGSLPTAATGGIYNTVTGHGSARDDHGQSYDVSQKDKPTNYTATDASIPSATIVFPTGGIYNTVIGHGSNDESIKPHETSGKNVQHTVGSSESLRRAASAAPEGITSFTIPTVSSHASYGMADTADRRYGEPAKPRAFPLTSSDRDGHHEEKPRLTEEPGLPVGALAAIGAVADEYSNQHSKEHGPESRYIGPIPQPMPASLEHEVPEAQPTAHHSQTAGDRTSLDGKEKHKDDASTIKEHHGVLGIFHRHKDNNTGDETKHSHSRHESHERRRIKKEPPSMVTQMLRESPSVKNNADVEDKRRQTGTSLQSRSPQNNSHAVQESSYGGETRHTGPYKVLTTGAASGVTTSRPKVPTAVDAESDNSSSHTNECAHPSVANDKILDTTPSQTDSWRSVLPPTLASTRATETSSSSGIASDKHLPSHPASSTRQYNALELGTTQNVPISDTNSPPSVTEVASQSPVNAAVTPLRRHGQELGTSSALPNPYNILPSGTLSGVNIEYRRKPTEIGHVPGM